ncbi:hypothetical protein FP435_07645 [Lactobacillus sp. PV037]|uniref:hypothetical protein n=1 Tax=unclassified Lactobacillus TaxID=2620435 RepID=UPI0022409C06|nr:MULTISPECIES: hypothetical protein [unclassified Lactobacillus]QNQ81655.1 hypothetical protein FP433_00610 [Lactobacillus sp. PV012]QNQ84298.1 hypothetical protein FP435_07645 [Lactobacillus sp. PV037]
MRHAILDDNAYKVVKYGLIIATLIILVLPWINKKQLNYWLIGTYLLIFGDWLATFFQHHSVNVVLALVLGYLIDIIVCVGLLFYTMIINV